MFFRHSGLGFIAPACVLVGLASFMTMIGGCTQQESLANSASLAQLGSAELRGSREQTETLESDETVEATETELDSVRETAAGTLPSIERSGPQPSNQTVPVDPPTAKPSPVAQDYRPHRPEFRALYEQDAVNQGLQTFDEYFRWVDTFFVGNLLEVGWNRRSNALKERLCVLEADDAEQICSNMLVLGKLLASEWAKCNPDRKIKNSHLMQYGKRIQEIESVQALQLELDTMITEVRELIGTDAKTEAK